MIDMSYLLMDTELVLLTNCQRLTTYKSKIKLSYFTIKICSQLGFKEHICIKSLFISNFITFTCELKDLNIEK